MENNSSPLGIGSQEPGKVSPKEFKVWQGLVIGILVLVAITFITLVVQYFTATQVAFQSLVNTINKQDSKIESLNTKVDFMTSILIQRKIVNPITE